MSVKFGRNAFVKVGEESTYGTAAASGYTDMRLISTSLQKTIERARKTHLDQGTVGFVRSTFDSFNVTGGNITGPLHYAGNGDILLAALGKVTTTGSSPYVHLFEVQADLPSLTMTVTRGAASSGNPNLEEFKGCIISQLTIACAAGEEATFSAEVIAQDASARAGTAVAAAFPATALSVLHHQSSTMTWNSNPYTIRSFEIVVDNKIERRNNLGSQLTAEPNISDVREVRMNVTADLEDTQIYTDFITTPTAVDGNVVLTMTGTGNDVMVFTIYNAVLEEYSDAVTTFGRIERTMTFLGTVNGANEAISISMQNDNSGAI